ncbi:olfactory receptor-like protein COR6 [Bombina bombina]|uniref:olfactory receptor-like protein COR6 n=1 Tax=Bombina bombina TaxID=8345 RepID=UPI00235AC0A2|nr:olfactory receptor-like protein COR6 [Bombina bombina]
MLLQQTLATEYLYIKNKTSFRHFILLGLTSDTNLKLCLFFLFLFMYILTVIENIGIITLFTTTPRLQTPMYFFLSHLSFSDLCYSSVISPKLLDILMENQFISYSGCIMQLFIFTIFGILQCLILSVMAYDRSVAVSKPLFYNLIMTDNVCKRLIAVCYTIAVLFSLLNTLYTLSLSFCNAIQINHFYCDYIPLLQLACSDTFTNLMVIFITVSSISSISIGTIIMSYGYIIFTVFGIRSKQRRYKVFYTCSSHLTTVSIFYGTVFFMYIRPASKYFTDEDKVVAVFYTVAIPFLNPIIYSMRNKDLQSAFNKNVGKWN